jgi:FkbM family methyltransferase
MYALRVYFFNLKRILRNYRVTEALFFLLIYTIYWAKYNILSRLLRIKIKNENVFGRKVFFFSYKDFIGLFEEIFIGREYYFECKKKDPVIMDFGSNIGMSVIYFKWLYPGAVITAVEADLQTFAMLKKNVEINGFTGVTLMNNVVHDRLAKVKFYYDNYNTGSLQMSMKAVRGPGSSFNSIKTILASQIINSNVDMIKMDIEGAEGAVINEMAKKGRLVFVSRIAVEVHHNMKETAESISGILRLLTNHGFRFQLFAPNNPPYFDEKFQDVMVYAEKK